MRRTCIILAVAAMLVAASPAFASASERYEDAVGDAIGDSPDIVSVTVSEPEEGPLIRFEIELAPERPFGTDMATWTDTVFVTMSADDSIDERGILDGNVYITGTHGVTLDLQSDAGAILVTPEDMYWGVVDLDSSGNTLVFTLDRKLIGDPRDLYFQVLLGVERDLGGSPEDEGEAEGDTYPDLGQPPAHVQLDPTDW